MTLPTMTPVTSSRVHSVGLEDGHIYVRFHAGKKAPPGTPGVVWRYPTERAGEHHAVMLRTDSPGRYFGQHIQPLGGEKVEET